MAAFTININTQVNTPYQSRVNSFAKGANCSGFVFEQTLSIATETPILDNVILLAPWMMGTAGLTLITMYVKDVVYSDSTKLWYEYNGIKLLPGVEQVIDITGLGYEAIVPLFKLKGAQPPTDTSTQTINCKIALKDNSPLKYEYRNNQMTVSYGTCV